MSRKPFLCICFGFLGLVSCGHGKREPAASPTQGAEVAKPDTDLRERAPLALTSPAVSTSVAYQENFSTKPDGSPYQTGNALVSRPGMYYSSNFSSILTDPSTGNNYVTGAGGGDARINFVNPLSGKIVLTFKGKLNSTSPSVGYTLVTLWNSADEQLDTQALGLYRAGGTATIRYNVITSVNWGTDWHTFKYEIDTAATANNIKITIDGSKTPNINATSSKLLNGNLKSIKVSQNLVIDDISMTGTQTPTVAADLEHFYSNDFESYNAGDSITTPTSGFIVRANGFGPVTQGANSKNNTRYVTGTEDGASGTGNPISAISFVPINSRMEISFRLRAPNSTAQYDSFGIYSYDTPIFMLTYDYKGLGLNGVYYISGIAPDDWADIKIVTDPALSTNNAEIFVNTLSTGRVTIPNLSTTKVNGIRFGAVMTIDNLDIAGVYAAPLQSFTNTSNTVKQLYDSSVTKVAALPATSQDDKLRKVAFQWALDQSKQMLDLGLQKYDERLIYGAQGILNDISTHYSDATVTQKNAEPANLFPTITADCPYKSGIFTVKSYGTIVPSSIPAFSQHDVVIKFAYAFLHPQSPSYGDTAIMESLLSLMYSNNVYNHDEFSFYEVQSYILFNKVYPNLILPAAKAKIEESMRAWATSDQNFIRNIMASGDYARYSWLNGDINSILSVGIKGIALNDQSMIDATNNALPSVYKVLLPDGATNYAGNATEVPTYHWVAIDAMAWYWLFTGNQKAYDFVANSVGYWPMNNNAGISEYYTAASWKYYWNGGAASSPTVASLTKDSYNYQLAGSTPSLLASLLWKAGVPALKAAPDNYVLFDRNIIGPRAKYGTFNYALVTRDPGYGVYTKSSVTDGSARGLGSFFGMAVLNNTTGWSLNAAAQEFMGSIRNGSSSYFLATGITSSVSMANSVQGLSAKYSLTDRLNPLAGFENTQQWVTSRDRAIGMLSIKSTVNSQVNAVNAVAKFISGRRGVGTTKQFQILDSNTYQYGNIKIRITDSNFGRVDYSYSNAYDADPNPPYDGQKGTLTFKDPLSMNDSTVKHTYTAGTTYYYLVELIPATSTFSTIKKLNLGNGLIGFEYDDGSKKVVMIHNPSNATVTGSYSNAPGYSQYSIHLGTDGTIDRDKFGNMDNLLLKASTSNGNSVSASSQAFNYTIPAGRHILHIGSNNADDHIAGFKFYENVFNGK